MAFLQRKSSEVPQLLPGKDVSEQESLVVVKKLLAIAVSGITYLRGIFPGTAYESKYVEDQQVMILKAEPNCPGASQILKWMHVCFDAIQKKYLRTVIMSIYTDPENPQKVTEYYQFKVQYTAEGAHMDFESENNQNVSSMSFGNTRKASILLVRKLYILMQNLGPLPENVYLNMKLAYYDDVTPQDYHPLGFREADGDVMEFEHELVKLTMGEVSTPFHSVRFNMATEKRRLEQVEDIVPVREKLVLNMEEDDSLQSHAPKEVEELISENTEQDVTEIMMQCHEKIETCEEVTETRTLVKETPDLEVGVRRTRSGRTIKSTAVSQYEIHSSQESSAVSVAKKKRRFSEPKVCY